MNKWKIILKAKDEDEAITYLTFLLNSFKAANQLNEPLRHVYGGDKDNKSKIICKKS